jgi:hypothetical protein
MSDEQIKDSVIADAKPEAGAEVVISGLSKEADGAYTVEEEKKFKTTLTPEQLEAALGDIRGRSFSGRNPHLGKMIKCQVCNLRHRENEKKCVQAFTYRIGDYEYFKEETNEETGETKLVPDLRTAQDAAIKSVGKVTKESVIGKASFAKKRFNPHPSKIKLQFIERVRKVYEELKFELVDAKSEEFKALSLDEQKALADTMQKNLHRARIVAARQLRKEREFSDRKYRRMRDTARRINLGLL